MTAAPGVSEVLNLRWQSSSSAFVYEEREAHGEIHFFGFNGAECFLGGFGEVLSPTMFSPESKWQSEIQVLHFPLDPLMLSTWILCEDGRYIGEWTILTPPVSRASLSATDQLVLGSAVRTFVAAWHHLEIRQRLPRRFVFCAVNAQEHPTV